MFMFRIMEQKVVCKFCKCWCYRGAYHLSDVLLLCMTHIDIKKKKTHTHSRWRGIIVIMIVSYSRINVHVIENCRTFFSKGYLRIRSHTRIHKTPMMIMWNDKLLLNPRFTCQHNQNNSGSQSSLASSPFKTCVSSTFNEGKDTQ